MSDQVATHSRRGHYIVVTPKPIARTSGHKGVHTTETLVAETSDRPIHDLATTEWRPIGGPNGIPPDTLARRALMDYVNQNYITRTADGRLLPADQANVAAALIRASYLFGAENLHAGDNMQAYPTPSTYTAPTAAPTSAAYTADVHYDGNEVSQSNEGFSGYTGNFRGAGYVGNYLLPTYPATAFSSGAVGHNYENNPSQSYSGSDGTSSEITSHATSEVNGFAGNPVKNYLDNEGFTGYGGHEYSNFINMDYSGYGSGSYTNKLPGYGIKSIPGHYFADSEKRQNGKNLIYTTTYSGSTVNTARPQIFTTPAPTTAQPVKYKAETVTFGRGFETTSESSTEVDQTSNYKSTEINNAVYQAYDRQRPYFDDEEEESQYKFGYRISDTGTGMEYGQAESREGAVTRGHYHVLLPDGRMQHVHYWSDATGYHASISYD